jgi:hypothetical protein
MREHIRILGILNIIMGALGVLVGLAALLVMGGMAGFITASLHSGSDSDYQNGIVAAPLMLTIGFAAAIFFFVLSLPSIIGGWGLLRFRPWARILVIIVSVFNLFHVPLGTALGVYGFWVLFSPEAQQLLQNGGNPAALSNGAYRGGYPPPPAGAYAPPPPRPPAA